MIIETERQDGVRSERQPAHRNDWRMLLAVFTLAGVVESQAFGHLNAFTPLFLQQLHVAPRAIPTWTGILSSLGFVLGLPLLPFWGVWADRYSRKLIIVRSAYVEGVLFTVAAFSPNVWVLAVAKLLGGFVFGNTGVMLAMLADCTPRKRLGLAVGIASAGFPLGSSIGPYLGGLIAQGPGIRTLLFTDACLSAAMGMILTLVVREERRVVPVTATVRQLLRAAVDAVLASPVIVRLFALYFVAMYGISLANPFLPILLQRLYVGPVPLLPGVIGATLTAAGVAMAVTTPLWGRLGDVVGRWGVLPVCLGGAALGVVIEGIAGALFPLQSGIFVVGLFQGGIGATVIALLALLAPEERRARSSTSRCCRRNSRVLLARSPAPRSPASRYACRSTRARRCWLSRWCLLCLPGEWAGRRCGGSLRLLPRAMGVRQSRECEIAAAVYRSVEKRRKRYSIRNRRPRTSVRHQAADVRGPTTLL